MCGCTLFLHTLLPAASSPQVLAAQHSLPPKRSLHGAAGNGCHITRLSVASTPQVILQLNTSCRQTAASMAQQATAASHQQHCQQHRRLNQSCSTTVCYQLQPARRSRSRLSHATASYCTAAPLLVGMINPNPMTASLMCLYRSWCNTAVPCAAIHSSMAWPEQQPPCDGSCCDN